MRYLVTGAAGFIGSHTVDRLLADGHEVIGVDTYITGKPEFLTSASESPRFTAVLGDLFDFTTVYEACEGVDAVFHLAANTDVRHGTEFPRRDLDQNVIVTWNILEAMRRRGIKTLLFASTGSLYGDTAPTPTPESAPLIGQNSLHHASKVAAEAFITAYAYGFGIRALLFRFASVVGERCSHGHIFDFCRQLHQHPGHLRVLCESSVHRSYLDVSDAVEAMLVALTHKGSAVEVFNVGPAASSPVSDAVAWVTSEWNLQPTVEYSSPGPVWLGSCPVVLLDCTKLRRLGWQPRQSPEAVVRHTAKYLSVNPWLLEGGS